MDVSVIIVNYNTKEILRKCLDSIISYTKDILYEVIIVDNASGDGSSEMISKNFSQFTLIANHTNLGFGKANNEGFKIARGRNLLLLNPDTVLQNNAIKILSDFLDKNEKYGVCGGNLLNFDLSPQPSFSIYFHSIRSKLSILLLLPNRKKINYTYNSGNEPIEVSVVFGAAFMVKSHIIHKVGGFNPTFFLYGEEDELCFRIKEAGYKIMNTPQSRIIHLDGASFDNSFDRLKRRNEGIKAFYTICYPAYKIWIIKMLDFAIIYSRLIFAYISSSKSKISFWKDKLKILTDNYD